MYCPYCAGKINQVKICPRCGQNVEIQNEIYQLPVGTILAGRYYIGRTLGQGGFGITYIGVDTRLDKRIAVKEYFPQGIVSRTSNVSRMLTVTAGEKSEIYFHEKQRFIREAKILADFADNRYVVQVSDVFEENNTAYIVMEYIDGITLGNYWAKKGSRSFDELFRMTEPLMAVLEEVNARGLVHRDISPANIMVVYMTGALKLLDFGAASEYDDGEVSRSVILKPGYAPLEQYSRHGNQGPWSDVYGLCATMYYLLTGITPQNAIERAAADTMEHPIRLGVDISREEDAVLMCGMAVRSELRPSSMQELRTAFRLAMEGKLIRKAEAFSIGGGLKSTVLDRQKGEWGNAPVRAGNSPQAAHTAGGWKHAVWIVLLLLALTTAAVMGGISRQSLKEKEGALSAVRRITEVLGREEKQETAFSASEEIAAETEKKMPGALEDWTGPSGGAEGVEESEQALIAKEDEEELSAEKEPYVPEEGSAAEEQAVLTEVAAKEEENTESEQDAAESPLSAALASSEVDLYTETELFIFAGGNPLTPEDGEVLITPSIEGSIKVREGRESWYIKGWIPGTVEITVQKGDQTTAVTMTTRKVVPDVEIGSTALIMGEETKASVLAGDVPVVTNAKGLTIDVGNKSVLGIVQNGKDLTVKALSPGTTELIVALYGEERRIPVTVSRSRLERSLEAPQENKENAAFGLAAADQETLIQYIRDNYYYTQANLGRYQTDGGTLIDYLTYGIPEDYSAENSEGLSSAGDPNGFISYNYKNTVVKLAENHKDDPGSRFVMVEAYFVNTERYPTADFNPITDLLFLFATGKDGKEYRYYFMDTKVIRYVDPDHETYDYPGGIDSYVYGWDYDPDGIYEEMTAIVPLFLSEGYFLVKNGYMDRPDL